MGVVDEAVHPVLGRRRRSRSSRSAARPWPGARWSASSPRRGWASLGHENIVEAFDFGEVRLGQVASYYVAMELLEGRACARASRGPTTLDGLLVIGQQAAAALARRTGAAWCTAT